MVVGMILLVRIVLYSTYALWASRVKNIAVVFLFCGNSLLLLTICIMTFKAKSSNTDTQYLNECFLYATAEHEKQLCRIQYFGQQILYPLLIYCAIIDFANIWDDGNVKKYQLNRLIWFSLALLISSLCTFINLLGNNTIYQKHVLANTSYVTCSMGYLLVVVVSSLSIIIQLGCFENWRTERRATRIMGYMTMLGVLFIQSRTFADLFVFCCMCLMMAADIQVVKET